MIQLDAATVLLQWATGGLLFLWVTTRGREVGVGYGWLLRGVYGVMATGAVAAGVALGGSAGRDLCAALTALATFVALGVSVVRRKAGVAGERTREQRVAARIHRSGDDARPYTRSNVTRTEVMEAATPFLDGVHAAERQFDDAIGSGDARGAVKAVLDLDNVMAEWAHETFSADEEAQARAALRSMVTRLGEAADSGLRDPREAIAPYVDALLDARDRARNEQRFDDADAIRERLTAAGVEIRDTQAGTDWTFDH